MSYLALARRYRPGDFDTILSQHHITTTLKNAVSLGRVSHAYLFCGPRGTGKTTTARVLAKALNCEKGPTPEPCGECTVCREITIGSSPDVFEIDAASNRGIDDIRELRENVRYSPVGGRYKIYIIDEIHRLTREAFDALLKTLEEPPSHVIFIFATTDPQALPATILSRTQRYDFKRIPVSALAEAVNSIAHKEGLSIDPNAALLVAKKADGSLRDALSLLDQLSSFSDSNIEMERAAEILGVVKTDLLFAIAQSIINHDAAEALAQLSEFTKSGGDPPELAGALTGYIRTLLLIRNGVDDIEILELDKMEMEKANKLVAEIDPVDLLRYFTALADYKWSVKQGQDPVFTLETTVVKMAAMDRAVSLEELLKGMQMNSTSRGFAAGPPRNAPSISGQRGSDKAEKSASGMMSTADDPPPNTIPKRKRTEGSLTLETISAEWDGFCKFVFKKDKAIFAHLGMCKPSAFDDGLLTVTVNGNGNFQYEQLSRPGRKSSLVSLLEEYFSSDIKLKLLAGSFQAEDQNSTAARRESGKEFEGSPVAKKLFDLLGGEIIGQ
ncbi:MAG: DNA polymerase III subunit gamma/tau [candidate division Zixibacteria bacterium]